MGNNDSELDILAIINELREKLVDLSKKNNFLNFTWNTNSIPIVDVDFFELFLRLVNKREKYTFTSELTKNEIENRLSDSKINRLEKRNLKKTLDRIYELDADEYYSQNSLSLFSIPKYYINRIRSHVFNSPLSESQLLKRLDLISQKYRQSSQEKGISNLFIALGFLRYNDAVNKNDYFNAPLVLVPVIINKNNGNYEVMYNNNEEIKLNKSLKLKLNENNFNLPISEIKSEQDLISYLTNIYETIPQDWQIKPYVSLGLFNFKKLTLYDDLNIDNCSEDAITELKYYFSDDEYKCTTSFDDTKIDSDLDIKSTYNVLDADSSQISVIEEAKLGNDLVVEGPPGTGKSQTIVNLIAEIIANKKTVLFVSEKMSAIEVVKDRLDDVGLGFACLELHSNNSNKTGFLDEISKTMNHSFDELYYNESEIESKMIKLQDLKFKLNSYVKNIHTNYANSGMTPYYLMGLKESSLQEIENNNSSLKIFNIPNIGYFDNIENKDLFSNVSTLSSFYKNKIINVSNHKFKDISTYELSDSDFSNIINTIPNTYDDLSKLIDLTEDLNKEYGIRKLLKLNDYKEYVKNIEILEHNPRIMGEDEDILIEYIDSLKQFQQKSIKYGSIDKLENQLIIDAKKTKNELSSYIIRANNLKKDISTLNELIINFNQELANKGIKPFNSISEIRTSLNNLDILHKSPSLIKNEGELNSFIDDVEKYQINYTRNSPKKLLNQMDEKSKFLLNSTLGELDRLLSLENNVSETSDYINKINDLKSEIGLNQFNFISDVDESISKLNILVKNPILINNIDEMECFINDFTIGKEKFSNLTYTQYYDEFSSGFNKIQDEIRDNLTQFLDLESTLPTICEEIENIQYANNQLVEMVNSKKITKLNEIDEYISVLELILKNPRFIDANLIDKINYSLKLITDVQNQEKYTKLSPEELEKIKTNYIASQSQLSQLNFDKNVLNLDFDDIKEELRSIKNDLMISPVKSAFYISSLESLIHDFEINKNKPIKIMTNFKKVRDELINYYGYYPPEDDDKIVSDYKELLNIKNQFNQLKFKLVNYHIVTKVNPYPTVDDFENILDILIQLKKHYNDSKDAINDVLPQVTEDNLMNKLVDVEIKLNDINNFSEYDSLMKDLFPEHYMGFSSNLNDLYNEYVNNRNFTNLVNEGYFEKDTVKKIDLIEYQDIIEDLKQSKARVYYYINLINNSLDMKDSLLCMKNVFKVDLDTFLKYCEDLLDEIINANDLFDDEENYALDDIDKVMEKYNEVIEFDNLDSLINLKRFKNELEYYQREFSSLTNFNSFDEDTNHKSIIDVYYNDIWKSQKTDVNQLNSRFNDHKTFTELYNENFFSDNVFTFLNQPENIIKSKLNEFKTISNILSKKITSFSDELVFYDENPVDLEFNQLLTKNNEILRVLSKVKNQKSVLLEFNSDNLTKTGNGYDLESDSIIRDLSDKLNVIYTDSDINKFNISFDNQKSILLKVNELDTLFIDLITLRDSINERQHLINNHFVSSEIKFNLWNGPLSSIDMLKFKVNTDKKFTRLYNEGFYSDKTVNIIKNNPLVFDGFLNLLKSMSKEINEYSKNLNEVGIITYASKEKLSQVNFSDIFKKNDEVMISLDKLTNDYDEIKLRDDFNLKNTTLNLDLFSKIINSDYVCELKDNEILDNYLSSQQSNLDKLNELYSLKDNFDNIQIDKKYFKTIWNGYDTSINELNNQLEINREFERLINEEFFTPKIKTIIESAVEDIKLSEKIDSEYDKLYQKVESQVVLIKNIIANFDIINLIYDNTGKLFLENNIVDLYDDITYFNENISDLKEWRMFQKYILEYDNDYTHEFIELLSRDEIESDVLESTFKYNFANNFLNEIKSNNKTIGLFDVDTYNNLVHDFKKLDKEVIELNRLRVIHSLKNTRFNDNNQENPEVYKAHTILNKELGLKRNIKPIRTILRNTIEYIKTIKPIFIMSPISVAQYLESNKFESYFDYVIFDEASQVKIEDSISTLLRGKTKIVIGDTKQLPPTTFFEKEQVDVSESTYKNIESILHLCKSKFKIKSLKWHYRSKHESLISVSNEEFYDNNLLVFPSANMESEELGLKLKYCDDTVYNRGTTRDNELEAEKIVDFAIEHVKTYGFSKSLGVATFSEAQRNTILKVLKKRLDKSPELIKFFNPVGLNAFFVKNIETIQGDERDVILISVGYGFDKNHKLTTNFGPLNNDGGERRLNVLITRAKEKMVIFSNFKSKDITDDLNIPQGVKSLKTLLYYAEKGEFPKTKQSTKRPLSLFEESVYNFLISKGFTVEKQVGCEGYRVDLAIIDDKNPKEYLLAIECDGYNYNKSKVTRDRERLHEEILEKLGWNYYRIWANDWVTYREDSRNALLNEINQCIDDKYASPVEEPAVEVGDPFKVDVDIDDDCIIELLFEEMDVD